MINKFNLNKFIYASEIVTNPDHPNCYICNNGLCHLDCKLINGEIKWKQNLI